MSDNLNTQESPPEIQFAGVNRWLKENLFSSTGSSILTFLSIGVIIGLFRSIIGFFISGSSFCMNSILVITFNEF